jgi:tRNA uridine 5-carboxymethylaminomethyl modification enzyme
MLAKIKLKGGRLGDHVSKGLSSDFEKVGIKLKRFKTGTPPRILGRTINFAKTTIQKGDLLAHEICIL